MTQKKMKYHIFVHPYYLQRKETLEADLKYIRDLSEYEKYKQNLEDVVKEKDVYTTHLLFDEPSRPAGELLIDDFYETEIASGRLKEEEEERFLRSVNKDSDITIHGMGLTLEEGTACPLTSYNRLEYLGYKPKKGYIFDIKVS